MKCYIRNLLIFCPNQKAFDDEKYSIEAIVNNYPKHERAQVRIKREEKEREWIIGEVLRVYINDGCIYGDIEFTYDWKDIVYCLHKKPYTEAELRSIGNNPDFSCLDKVIFVDNENYTKPVDLGSIISEQEYAYWMFNRPHYDSAQEAMQSETDTLFKKKYDDVNSGFIGTVESTNSKGKEPVITFDNEGQDIGGGIMRYGHYKNGALMGYVIVKVTEFGGDGRRQESLDILEKFTEHQRGNFSGFIGTVKPTGLEEKFTTALYMQFSDNALETRMLKNGKELSHMHSYEKHAGKIKTNSEDAYHLQELHSQVHRYIWKEILSGVSSAQD